MNRGSLRYHSVPWDDLTFRSQFLIQALDFLRQLMGQTSEDFVLSPYYSLIHALKKDSVRNFCVIVRICQTYEDSKLHFFGCASKLVKICFGVTCFKVSLHLAKDLRFMEFALWYLAHCFTKQDISSIHFAQLEYLLESISSKFLGDKLVPTILTDQYSNLLLYQFLYSSQWFFWAFLLEETLHWILDHPL